MKYLIMSIFSFLSLFSCKGYSDLKDAQFEAMLADDASAQLVDVRTPEEYAEGHLRGAINIDWYADDFMTKAEALLLKDRPVLVYCRSGRRSASASAKLEEAGFKVYNLLGGYLGWTDAGKPVSTYGVERFITPSGEPVDISLIKHGSLELRFRGLSIQVDPVSGLGKPTDYAAEFPKADFILVTHEHGDHLDKVAIDALAKEDTHIVMNESVAELLRWRGYGEIMHNGDESDLADGILLEAVPAYNYTEGHLQFHPKGRDNGFVLTLDGLRIYIAGDTEDIPEMAEIKDIDIAFLPVNQPYTMTVEQCVKAANMIKPKVLIPYHFGQTDLSGLPEQLPDIKVLLRQMQ